MKKKLLSVLVATTILLGTTANVYAASGLSDYSISLEEEQISDSFDGSDLIIDDAIVDEDDSSFESGIEAEIEDSIDEASLDSLEDSIVIIDEDDDEEDDASDESSDAASDASSDSASTHSSVNYDDIVFGNRQIERDEHLESVFEGAEGTPAYDEIVKASYPTYYVTPNLPDLRNQNPYGTCWAHATIALADIGLRKKGIYSDADMSELHLAYFSYNFVEDPLGGTKGDTNTLPSGENFLDTGGNASLAANVMSNWTGAADESTAPYSSAASALASGLSKDIAYKDKAHMTNYYLEYMDLESLSPSNLQVLNGAKELITKYGAIAIGYLDDDSAYSYTYNSYYNPYNYGGGHAVTVVGWNDNFSKNNFYYTPAGDGAWLVRNSWTTGSENSHFGYFWMSYYEKTLDTEVIAAEYAKSSNYDNNYQYDGSMANSSISGKKFANVFTAKSPKSSKETLEAAAFMTPTSNVSYTIKVYTNLTSSSNPESGTLAVTKTGTTTYAGYYTVPLGKSISLSKGTKFSIVVELNKSGYYTFMGVERSADSWFISNASISSGQSFYMSGSSWSDFSNYWPEYYGNLKIKAFTKNASSTTSYKISFNANGGSVSPKSKTVTTTTYSALPTPTRTGYTFKGWNSKKDGSGTTVKKGSKLVKKANHTLYAQWKVSKYTIKFAANNGSGSMKNISATYGKSYTLTKNAFTRTGYKFNGWNTKKDGSGKKYANSATVKNLSSKSGATVTLYAQWKVLSYTVKFESNGGSTVTGQIVKYDTKNKHYGIANKPINPTRKGYTFKGWYSDKNLKKSYNFSTQVKKNMTLYAKWVANKYTVKFNANGGTGTMTALSCTYGKTYTLTKNSFKRAGYSFNGWNTKKDGSGTTYKNGVSIKNLSTKSGGTVTLYAQWKRNS